MNVLITSASRKVALVRAFQHALAAHGGGRVVAVDTSPLSPALYLADDHELVPRSDAPEFIDAMLALCRRREVRLLVPTRDEELPVFAAARERFAEAGTLVAVASPETVRTCQDKRAFASFCTANGFSAPRSYEPDEALSGSTWPLFVKPRFGKGGAHTERVDGPADLRRALDRVPELLVQAHVSAPELTVDLFADFGGEVLSAVVRERTRVVAGESYVSRTLDAPQIAAVAARVAHALGLVAHNTLQCFSLDGDAVLIEVNPRYGGAANLGFAAGAPTPSWLVSLARGERVAPRLGAYQKDLVMLRYTDDLFLHAASLDVPGRP